MKVLKLFLNMLKWVGIFIGSLLTLLVLAGLFYRLFGPSPNEPRGKRVDIGGFNLHIESAGEKGDKPTLVIEGGSGVAGEYYHWLFEGLKDSMRVVRYDRAGIGYSDPCETPRDPEVIARELHTLLEKAGEEPPYILAGHSLGGPYISVYNQLYPGEAEALVFLDATHPERVERLDLPKESSSDIKMMLLTYKALGVLADLGIVGLYERIQGTIIPTEGLPEEVAERTRDFLLDGKLARTAAYEMEWYHRTLRRANEASHFDSLPIRMFIGGKPMSKKAEEHYKKRGIDIEARMREGERMKQDFASRSTDSKTVILDGDHNSMYTIKENADVICEEILLLGRK